MSTGSPSDLPPREPLSNLDAKLREEMRFELKRLQRELGITGLYVTHDQVEALAMSNRVAAMRDGRFAARDLRAAAFALRCGLHRGVELHRRRGRVAPRRRLRRAHRRGPSARH